MTAKRRFMSGVSRYMAVFFGALSPEGGLGREQESGNGFFLPGIRVFLAHGQVQVIPQPPTRFDDLLTAQTPAANQYKSALQAAYRPQQDMVECITARASLASFIYLSPPPRGDWI